jgi:hypothetical protein
MVKVTISMSAALKEQLDRYAEAHSRVGQEQVDAPTLIPHMLALFVQRDRAFKVLSKLGDRPTPDASAD